MGFKKLKYLKMFDNYTADDLISILQAYSPGFPENRCTVENNKLSIFGYDINFNDLELEKCPVNFKDVFKAHFVIDNNKLITLKGCPETIPDGYFSCSNNTTLMSLEYMPNAYRVFYDDCGCSNDPNQLKFIPVDIMKRGEVYNYYNSSKLKNAIKNFFIYDQKDVDAYWDEILDKEPTIFKELKYNKQNKILQKSNYISWELSEKYAYLKRSDDVNLWGYNTK
jgi:hypothetical protein